MRAHCYYAAVGDNGGVVASSYEQALLYKNICEATFIPRNSLILQRLRTMCWTTSQRRLHSAVRFQCTAD